MERMKASWPLSFELLAKRKEAGGVFPPELREQLRTFSGCSSACHAPVHDKMSFRQRLCVY